MNGDYWPRNRNVARFGTTVVLRLDGTILADLWWEEADDGTIAVECFEFPEITTVKDFDELEALAELISMRGKPQQ